MRLLTTVLLLGSLAAGCNGSEPGVGTADNPAASTDSDVAREAGGSPAATAGKKKDAVPEVVWREVTIPAGTSLPLVLETPVASDTSRIEEPVTAHLTRAITVDGVEVVPEGSTVSGVVTDATRSGKVKGRAHVAIRFDTLVPRGPRNDGERYEIHTAAVGRTAPATTKKDAIEIGAPAAGGAIIGGIVGGKKGAAIGAAAGGGAGTAVVLSQRGKEVRLGKGASLSLELTEPLTVRVRS
jgi:hypothetical protein